MKTYEGLQYKGLYKREGPMKACTRAQKLRRDGRMYSSVEGKKRITREPSGGPCIVFITTYKLVVKIEIG